MLHGIEELTKDGDGYVYWRGIHCCYATTAQLLAWFDAKMSPPLVQPISFDLVPGVTIAFGVTKERA